MGGLLLVLPLCRDAVSVFSSPSRQSKNQVGIRSLKELKKTARSWEYWRRTSSSRQKWKKKYKSVFQKIKKSTRKQALRLISWWKGWRHEISLNFFCLWNNWLNALKNCFKGDHHHHHIALVARISLTLYRHSSLSFIALGRSSGQHPVSSHSCWMYVRAGRPAFARPCVGVHKSTSLMSSFLLLQQCPACLVRLTWIVFVIGGRWPYSWCLVGCCRQDLFKIARSILVQLPSSFFSSRFVSVHVMQPYSSIDVTAAWKKLCFILSVRSDFHVIDSLLIAVHAFVNLVSMSFRLIWHCFLGTWICLLV